MRQGILSVAFRVQRNLPPAPLRLFFAQPKGKKKKMQRRPPLRGAGNLSANRYDLQLNTTTNSALPAQKMGGIFFYDLVSGPSLPRILQIRIWTHRFRKLVGFASAQVTTGKPESFPRRFSHSFLKHFLQNLNPIHGNASANNAERNHISSYFCRIARMPDKGGSAAFHFGNYFLLILLKRS